MAQLACGAAPITTRSGDAVRYIAAILLLALVTSCGNTAESAEEAQPPASVSPTPTPTPSYTPSPTPTPTPTGATVRIICDDRKYNSYEFETVQDAWSLKSDFCIDTEASGIPSDREWRALKLAYPKSNRVSSLGTLYSICAENSPKDMKYLRHGNAGQLREYAGAYILCPKHPQRPLFNQYRREAGVEMTLIKQGRVFYSGTHRVGKKVPPGTYFTKNVEDCYWERTDRYGEIIDNNFISGAARVEVTIQTTDFSFHSEGCGEWRPVS